jgi:hypothetical protein
VVGYAFALRSPTDKLAEELRTRYRALEMMFEAYASDSVDEQRRAAAERVSRLAAAGQRGMLELYSQIVDRNLGRGSLPTEFRSTLLSSQNYWTHLQPSAFTRIHQNSGCNLGARSSRNTLAISRENLSRIRN